MFIEAMTFRVLSSEDFVWRATNVLGAENVDLGKQLGADTIGARLWRMRPGQASLRHRHRDQEELYILLDGEGRMRVDDQLLSLSPLSAVLVTVDAVRQLFNDTAVDQVWMVVGAPRERFVIAQLTDAERFHLYPDGLEALPPELERAGEPPA